MLQGKAGFFLLDIGKTNKCLHGLGIPTPTLRGVTHVMKNRSSEHCIARRLVACGSSGFDACLPA